MSLNACVDLVHRADPDRAATVKLATNAAQAILYPLYAFNIEVSRAPWVTAEPMIAQMRLQWWRDALDEISVGETVRNHDVVVPLSRVLDREAAECLDGLIVARYWDISFEPFQNVAQFEHYIDRTSGDLMWTAARLLGAQKEQTVRDFAFGAGVAAYLRAVPELIARGRQPLINCDLESIKNLSEYALNRLVKGAGNHKEIRPQATPAMLSGWLSKLILRKAILKPECVLKGSIELSDFSKQIRLLKLSYLGWWR